MVRSSARAREYEEAIQWLKSAGLIYKIHNISIPKMPLKAYGHLDIVTFLREKSGTRV